MPTYIKTGLWETLKTTAPKNWLNLTKLINDIVDSNYKSSILGSLKITDAAPTTQGLYILSDIGTYTNLGSIVTTTGKLNFASFDGTTWSKMEVEMPDNSAKALQWVAGTYEEGALTYNNGLSYRANKTTTEEPSESAIDWERIGGDISNLVAKTELFSVAKNLFNKNANKITLASDYVYINNKDTFGNNTLIINSVQNGYANNWRIEYNEYNLGTSNKIFLSASKPNAVINTPTLATTNRIGYFDSNNNILKVEFNTKIATWYEGVSYVRFNYNVNDANTIQIEYGTVSTTYEVFLNVKIKEEYLPNNVVKSADLIPINTKVDNAVSSIANKVDKQLGKNLFNKNNPEVRIGVFLSAIDKEIVNTDFFITHYIPVLPNTTYTISNFNSGGAKNIFYGSDKVMISVISGTTFTTPSNCYFIRISGVLVNIDKAQVEEGSTATSYEDYTELGFLLPLKKDISDLKLANAKASVILPNKLYFVKNFPTYLYRDVVLYKGEKDKQTLYINQGSRYDRLNVFNFTSAVSNQSMTFQVMEGLNNGELKTINYDVKDASSNNGKTINILTIGDSFTDIGTYQDKFTTLLTNNGVTVKHIGTVGKGNRRNESLSGGRLENVVINQTVGVARIITVTGVSVIPETTYPGVTYVDANSKEWTIRGGKIGSNGNGKLVVSFFGATNNDFTNFPSSGTLTKKSGQEAKEGDNVITYSAVESGYYNPFLGKTSGVLAIDEYLSFWGFQNPDVIVIQFTTNDVNKYQLDAKTTVVNQFKTVVDHFHTKLPNAKIILSIETFGAQNGKDNFDYRKYLILEFTKSLLDAFQTSAYSSFVFVCPSYAYVDHIYGYNEANVSPNPRYGTVTQRSAGDSVHPSTNGMEQIGEAIYQVISNIL